MKRSAYLALSALLLLGGCGSSDDVEDNASVSTPDDGVMKDAMTQCVVKWMSEVGAASAVDDASEDELAMASRVFLRDCGTQEIADENIGAGYACQENGCYGEDGFGHDWTSVAADWACENRPDLCAAID